MRRKPRKPSSRGRVTLVGAGPGDPELLTLKAIRALKSANVILYDALVSDEVLDLAKRTAKKMLVGKRGGRPSCKQDDINALMVTLARAGHHVVRLKAGDPMIFGRAGEEIAILEAASIEVTVIPGITAASAMASALGISLTHRDTAQAVHYVTGHSRHGGPPDTVDWANFTGPDSTTVLYMGGRTCQQIATWLIAASADPETPAVAISSVSRPEEQRWVGSLGDLAKAKVAFDPRAPVTIAYGQVFAAAGSVGRERRPCLARDRVAG